MLARFCFSVLILCLVATLSGCGPSREETIAAGIAVPPTLVASLQNKIAVGDVTGGSDMVMYGIGISSGQFKDILEQAFKTKGMLALGGTIAAYRVEADVTPDRNTNFGFGAMQEVDETVIYHLFDNASRRQDFTTSIKTVVNFNLATLGEVADPQNIATYLAFGPESTTTSGNVRLRAAYEKAIHDNIIQFLAQLADWNKARNAAAP